MKIIFLFIDGIGAGRDDPAVNPFVAARIPNFRELFSGGRFFAADAAMGVPGLPQSATGQTAVFTGVNAPEVLGRHLSGQPTITLKNIIEKNNIFLRLADMGIKPVNANIYRYEYLEKMLDPVERKYRPSVTSVMTMSAGLPFKTAEDYEAGTGVYHDITGDVLRDYGYEVSVISPREAARRVAALTNGHDFVLFEHFMTDIIGHTGEMQKAVEHLEMLDVFVGELAVCAKMLDAVLVIASDHGNIEDMSVRTHTVNPAIVLFKGFNRNSVNAVKKVRDIMDLTDIMPAVLELELDS